MTQKCDNKNLFILLLLLGLLVVPIASWKAYFEPAQLQMQMGYGDEVKLSLADVEPQWLEGTNRYSFHLDSSDTHLANVAPENATIRTDEINLGGWTGRIRLHAYFLGEARITVRLYDALNNISMLPENNKSKNESVALLKIVRPERVIDHVFVGSIILLMSLVYINFGAALNLQVLRGLITRPIAPSIALVTQVVGMPLLAYALGVLIFPGSPAMQLGLFFTGIVPSGGASNTWAAVLNANLDLSVLMTTISNFAGFLTMPLWAFTLGQLIFERADIVVPYSKIATYCLALTIPLLIGLAIQRWQPRLAQLLVRLLKPLTACIIIFIIIFAIVVNFYLFQLFSWQIAVAGLALPGLGCVFAWLTAKLFKQNAADALAIAIETSIQNTGIAIFFLRTALPQPQADLTTVIPVAVAIMTPLPMLGIYIFQRCCQRKGLATNPAEHQRIV